MVTFEIIQQEQYFNIVKVVLEGGEVRTESGAMHYFVGDLEMEAKMPSVGGMLKSMFTSESAVKPTYKGTGELFLEPSFKNYTVMELNNEEWILDKGAYVASEISVTIGMEKNTTLKGLFGGEGFFQTKVSGTGKVVISSPGPIHTIELKDNRLVVDGNFAVAREIGLDYKLEKSSKGIFGSMISGEGLVNTFSGTGKVMIAPVPNSFNTLYSTITNQFSQLDQKIDTLSKISPNADK